MDRTTDDSEEIGDWVYFKGLIKGKRYNVYDDDGYLKQKDVFIQNKTSNSISFKICGIVIDTGIPFLGIINYATLISNGNAVNLMVDSFADPPIPIPDPDNEDEDPFLNIPHGDSRMKFKFKLLKDDKLSTCSISGGKIRRRKSKRRTKRNKRNKRTKRNKRR